MRSRIVEFILGFDLEEIEKRYERLVIYIVACDPATKDHTATVLLRKDLMLDKPMHFNCRCTMVD